MPLKKIINRGFFEMRYMSKFNISFVVAFVLSVSLVILVSYSAPVQYLLITFGERLVSRPLNHEVWIARFDNVGIFFLPILVLIFFLKCFSSFFVNKCNNSFINLLRLIAMLMVYFLHVAIITGRRGTNLFEVPYMRVFQTPAWGGMDFFYTFRIPCRKRFF